MAAARGRHGFPIAAEAAELGPALAAALADATAAVEKFLCPECHLHSQYLIPEFPYNWFEVALWEAGNPNHCPLPEKLSRALADLRRINEFLDNPRVHRDELFRYTTIPGELAVLGVKVRERVDKFYATLGDDSIDRRILCNVQESGKLSRFGEKGGGGAVLRNHHGAFLGAACQFFPHNVDPEAVEVLACRRAQTRNLSAVGPWIQEIKEMLNSFAEFRVEWIRRSGNIAAHKLAKVGVGEERCDVWVGSPPDFILDVISDEIPDLV
uniref:Uncharacterized protein n=1 Tax=Aegilops tauschii TaxID=37682 RepID=R7W4Q1_AEGTA